MANQNHKNKHYRHVSRETGRAVASAKKHPKAVIATVIILVLIIAVLTIIWVVRPDIYHKLLGVGEHTWSEPVVVAPTCGKGGSETRECTVCGDRDIKPLKATGDHNFDGENVCTVCGFDNSAPSVEKVSSSDLSIHFLELGGPNVGDCTLIKCGNTEVLIDAGAKRESVYVETVNSYISAYCTDGVLEYVIATHAHEDHIAALVGEKNKNNGVLFSFEIETIIQFAGHKTNSVVFNDYDAAVKSLKANGTNVYSALDCWNETDGAQRQYYLDADEKISLNILYQKYYEQSTSNENNYSVCTLLTQEVSSSVSYNYLFTGDLEEAGEKSLVENNALPKCKLYKGGHHGSSTSSNDVLLEVIRPENIAICTCAGTYEYAEKPNEEKGTTVEETKLNTFPTQEAIERMAKWTDKIYVTTLGVLRDDLSTEKCVSMNGNIVFYSTGGQLKLWCSNNDTVLKDTEWFAANRTWPEYGVS